MDSALTAVCRRPAGAGPTPNNNNKRSRSKLTFSPSGASFPSAFCARAELKAIFTMLAGGECGVQNYSGKTVKSVGGGLQGSETLSGYAV